MTALAVLFDDIDRMASAAVDRLIDRLTRRMTPSYPFTDHRLAAPASPSPGLSTPPAGFSLCPAGGQADTPTRTTHPLVGAGLHAPGCAYSDDPLHLCVTETGQPSRTTCLATWYRHNRLPKEVA